MDIRKILRIINLIINLDKEYNLQWLFQSINTYFEQQNIDQIKKVKSDIYEYINKSEIWNFVNSDIKILKNIWIYWFFDISVIDKFDNILKSGYETKTKLTSFVSERNELLDKIETLKSSIEWLWVELDKEELNNYSLIFSFPEKYHHLDNLEKVTNDIKNFLNELNSNWKEREKFKITSVNNWCIEFFIQAWVFLADNFSIAVDYFIKAYTLVKAWEDWKKSYKNWDSKRKKEVEKIAKEQLEEDKKELLESFIKDLEVNELTIEDASRLKWLFVKLSKHFEEWVTAEVKTPLIEKPENLWEESTEEEKSNFETNNKLYNKKTEIDERNKQLYMFQQENIKLSLPENIKIEEDK